MSQIEPRSTERGVDLNQVFRALSHPTRRRVLAAITIDDTRRVDEFETAAFVPDGHSVRTVSMELHHSHLPRLDEAGLIDWNDEAGTVTRGEHFAETRAVLEVLDDHWEVLPEDWP